MTPNKNKIAILSAFYEPSVVGGAEKVVKEILVNLGDRHRMILLTARIDATLPVAENKGNYQIKRLGIGHPTIDKFLFPFLAAWETKKIKPQIAHAIMESYAGIALLLLKFIHPSAYRILTLQSGNLDDHTQQKKWYIRLPWKAIHLAPHKITAISNFLAKRAIRLGAKKKNVVIIPNGVDFSEVATLKEKNANQVICVGRFSWEKDHTSLLTAWPEVLNEIPDAKLILVSDGELKNEIEKLAVSLQIENSVQFLGAISHKEVMKRMSESDVFICPSLAEGLGIVFIEAQASGTATIGTRVGGIPDVIQHEKNGLLIAPKNVKAISQAIIRLLKDDELRSKLSRKGLQTSKKFGWNLILKRIDEIYQYALNGKES